MHAFRQRESGKWCIKDLQIFYAKKPLVDLEATLYLPNLPNVNSREGGMCIHYIDYKKFNSFKQAVEKAVTDLWTNTFGNDPNTAFQLYSRKKSLYFDPRLESIQAWEQASQENPNFMTKVKLKPLGSVKSLLETYYGRYASGRSGYSSLVKFFTDIRNRRKLERMRKKELIVLRIAHEKEQKARRITLATIRRRADRYKEKIAKVEAQIKKSPRSISWRIDYIKKTILIEFQETHGLDLVDEVQSIIPEFRVSGKRLRSNSFFHFFTRMMRR